MVSDAYEELSKHSLFFFFFLLFIAKLMSIFLSLVPTILLYMGQGVLKIGGSRITVVVGASVALLDGPFHAWRGRVGQGGKGSSSGYKARGAQISSPTSSCAHGRHH